MRHDSSLLDTEYVSFGEVDGGNLRSAVAAAKSKANKRKLGRRSKFSPETNQQVLF